MRAALIASATLALAATACGPASRFATVDIQELVAARSGATGHYDINVRAVDLRAALVLASNIDLQIVACANPDQGGEVLPVSLGGTRLYDRAIRPEQISDDPDMTVGLTAEIPARALAAGQCARLHGAGIRSRPVPLPAP